MSLKSFLKELEVLFLLMFPLTDRTLCGVSVFTSHTAVGELPSPVSGGGERESRALAPLRGPSPVVSVFLSHFVASRVRCQGGRSARCGERKDSSPSRVGNGRGTAALSWFLSFTGGAGCLEWGWTGG